MFKNKQLLHQCMRWCGNCVKNTLRHTLKHEVCFGSPKVTHLCQNWYCKLVTIFKSMCDKIRIGV